MSTYASRARTGSLFHQPVTRQHTVILQLEPAILESIVAKTRTANQYAWPRGKAVHLDLVVRRVLGFAILTTRAALSVHTLSMSALYARDFGRV